MDILSRLFMDIVAFDPHLRRTNHLLKVTSYGVMIAEEENLPADKKLLVQTACLLHDIGIKPSLEKYNSSAGHYQHIEGPPLVKIMLEKHGFRPEFVDRVCFLVAHHHDYANVDDLDYRILVEAACRGTCAEGELAKAKIADLRDSHFKTAAGIRLLNALFELEGEQP